MPSLFTSPPKPKTPPPPKEDQREVQKASADARLRASLAKGRSSTILADNQGLGYVG